MPVIHLRGEGVGDGSKGRSQSQRGKRACGSFSLVVIYTMWWLSCIHIEGLCVAPGCPQPYSAVDRLPFNLSADYTSIFALWHRVGHIAES